MFQTYVLTYMVRTHFMSDEQGRFLSFTRHPCIGACSILVYQRFGITPGDVRVVFLTSTDCKEFFLTKVRDEESMGCGIAVSLSFGNAILFYKIPHFMSTKAPKDPAH